jgi:hypothetical protein
MNSQTLIKITLALVYAFVAVVLALFIYKIVEFYEFKQWIIIFLCVTTSHWLIDNVLKIIKEVSKDDR